MEGFDYLGILKKAWETTLRHRFLWWFGLILGGGGSGLNLPGQSETDPENGWEGKTLAFFQDHTEAFFFLLALIFLMAIVLFILRIRATAGTILALKALGSGEATGFRKAFAAGRKHFGSLLALSLLVALITLGLIIVIALPIVYLFYHKAYLLGVLAAFPGSLALILAVILITYTERFAALYLVTADLSLSGAVLLGYRLFMRNIARSILFSLIFIPIELLVFFGIFLVLLVSGGFFFLIGLSLFHFFSWSGAAVPAGIGLLTIVSFLLAIRSFSGTFFHTAWFYFFESIASVPEEKEVGASAVFKNEERAAENA